MKTNIKCLILVISLGITLNLYSTHKMNQVKLTAEVKKIVDENIKEAIKPEKVNVSLTMIGRIKSHLRKYWKGYAAGGGILSATVGLMGKKIYTLKKHLSEAEKALYNEMNLYRDEIIINKYYSLSKSEENSIYLSVIKRIALERGFINPSTQQLFQDVKNLYKLHRK